MAQLVKENESLRSAIEQARSYQRARPRVGGKSVEVSTPPLNPSSPPACADELAAVLLAVHHRPVEFRAPKVASSSPPLPLGAET
eukprot:COSAG02_NODE_22922_length_735_cov_3.515723_2_plen_84_part_01